MMANHWRAAGKESAKVCRVSMMVLVPVVRVVVHGVVSG
jgi:ribosomal protein S12 methylthiotransferase accessory factor YcaO